MLRILEVLMRTKRVVVEKYDPAWAQDFEKIRNELCGALGGLFVSIEHVGSTSVPGLSAKPVIDIDVVIEDYGVFAQVVEALSGIGYEHEGDLGIAGREAFRYSGKEHLKKHHLYVCPRDSGELRRHVAFRDYLRAYPEAAEEYGRVKMEGAAMYLDNIDGYIAHKTDVILKIYAEIEKTRGE